MHDTRAARRRLEPLNEVEQRYALVDRESDRTNFAHVGLDQIEIDFLAERLGPAYAQHPLAAALEQRRGEAGRVVVVGVFDAPRIGARVEHLLGEFIGKNFLIVVATSCHNGDHTSSTKGHALKTNICGGSYLCVFVVLGNARHNQNPLGLLDR